jgi:penicillin amidase
MIVQMSKNIEAYGVYPGGQSGNPGSRYYDAFVNDWAAGTYYPLLFIKEADAKEHGKIKWRMTFSKA